PAVGAWLGCGGLVITLALRQPLLPDSLTLAGISIQPLDVVAVVLGSAGARRINVRFSGGSERRSKLDLVRIRAHVWRDGYVVAQPRASRRLVEPLAF